MALIFIRFESTAELSETCPLRGSFIFRKKVLWSVFKMVPSRKTIKSSFFLKKLRLFNPFL